MLVDIGLTMLYFARIGSFGLGLENRCSKDPGRGEGKGENCEEAELGHVDG